MQKTAGVGDVHGDRQGAEVPARAGARSIAKITGDEVSVW